MSLNNLAKRTAPQELTEFAAKQIQELLFNVQGIELIMLCSSDGFELASFEKIKTNGKGKLAAVSSSIVAMVQAFMQKLQLEGCQSITLDANNGKAILTAIPHPKFPMLILAMTTNDVLLGQLLYCTKKIAQDISNFQI
ncbi:roadblock/LC7 domain-containing protein [Acinetobacter schindleri]|uniref:roadblock/LC7 domain-containing protein n=1 Tax=Acinetobacter schindleri TaxID=108981 RepID=UPI0028110DC2|nr:roadblock/LC7 domain-containing protein [Acinetobacter schindleri]